MGMSDSIDELRVIASDLMAFNESFRSGFAQPIDRLKEAASKVGLSWSGSWLGYQSHVYFGNLTPPPVGYHFNRVWGLRGPSSVPTQWTEYKSEIIEAEIYRLAGNPELSAARKASEAGASLFNEKRGDLLSILHVSTASSAEPYLQKLLDETNAVELFTKDLYVQSECPKGQFSTRDALAASQGYRIPPHISIFGDLAELIGPARACRQLAMVARKAFLHLERTQRRSCSDTRVRTKIFIGHGGSKTWKELKDFVQDRLHLPWDEFNRVPAAGNTNIARLSAMLDAAAIAFVVMTAEDEQPDGKLRARMNVIHEAGLFQGRLGFGKAIILLEDGCEEFSNIAGLVQIRFPKDSITACFEEIRRVLEREGVIDGG